MKKHILLCWCMALTALQFSCTQEVKAPKAILPLPENKQVEWQKMETYAFIHFGLNSFNDREWGYGNSDPKTFNPTQLDCEQWVKTFVAAGMKGVILTAKHHDGFCLWPTHLTEYCIRNTPYKNGKGDIVGELSKACKKYGIKFGVYLSPWDRHQANYGTADYVDFYHQQLHELLTQYGDIFEVWFDGANGGDGWYGGAKDSRTIDRKKYYNYPKIHKMIDELQPQAIVFSDGGPGCRWVGNEKGFAGATNWSFIRKGEVYPGYSKYKELQYGHPDGNQWVAAECDVSIRPGWFYHPEEDNRVKTVEQLTDLYYRSVGHNGTLLLNFPVDRRGLIHPTDSTNAVNFHKNIKKQLSKNLLSGITAKVSNTRGGKYRAKALTDNNYDTYWATDDGITSASIDFKLQKGEKINRMMLQEYIPLGQRVKSFVVKYKQGGEWLPIELNEETTTIGYKRLLRFKTVTTDEIKIIFLEARGPLCINNIEAYYAGETKEVSFSTPITELKTLSYTIIGEDKEKSQCAQDKDDSTTCFINSKSVTLDLGSKQTISSLHYLPDQSSSNRGVITNYVITIGDKADDNTKVIAKGEFSNIKHNPILQSVYFTPIKTRFITLKATQQATEQEPIGFAELAIR